ncbi:autophagy protein 16 [Mytilinidion resinicola]|uniref:Autophagy protein 16 n=1 Tax=Mytilinidion resinicola TaxID=574789 RepID=A0A6A6Z8J8_9PEZI|nr:autophagy protein 16 [Mytilinidion resinicola]KAF2817128.1 autophagy protein 16 [Mytilinidion resinicola]
MSSWLEQYSSALDARDAREQKHSAYVDAYTKLADRTATLRSESATTPPETLPATPLPKSAWPSTPKGKSSPTPHEPVTAENLTRMRAELTAAQSGRAALEARVKSLSSELSTIRTQSSAQAGHISQLEQTKHQLERRVNDRAEELKGKGRLVVNVQDEMVALELQLNITEQKVGRLEKENAELTRRWLAKMEQEASDMNKSPFSR